MINYFYRYLTTTLLIIIIYFMPNTLVYGQSNIIYAPIGLTPEISNKTYSKDRPLRVLSLDGGGVRGVIPARILAEIEERTDKPISDLFDLIVGNSTGGIIALGLTTPDSKNKPKYTAKEILDLYKDNADKIFEKSFWRKVKSGWGLWDAKYDRKNLDEILDDLFGEVKLSQTLKPVLITSYLIDTAEVHLWTSRVAREEKKDYLLKDIAGATSAAPTYFPPKKMVDNKGNVTYESDGGIYANNPSTLAIAEIFRSVPNIAREDVLIISIGTGQVKLDKEAEKLENSGVIGWVINANLIDVMMNATNDLFEWQTSLLNNSSKRIQVEIPEKLGDMDNASDANIHGLLEVAGNYIKNNGLLRPLHS